MQLRPERPDPLPQVATAHLSQLSVRHLPRSTTRRTISQGYRLAAGLRPGALRQGPEAQAGPPPSENQSRMTPQVTSGGGSLREGQGIIELRGRLKGGSNQGPRALELCVFKEDL